MKFPFVLLGMAIFIASCSVEDSVSESEPNPPAFDKIAEFQTDVPEPSGLTLDNSSNYLWTVSDNTNQVYKLDLTGNILKILDFSGDDLEGIAYDSRDATLWLAEEELRELVHIDTNGVEIGRYAIKNLEGSGNSGIEGVCLDAETFSVLNEKDPALWAELDSNYSAILTETIPEAEDLSGITYAGNNEFLIVSDQAQKLLLWSPENGTVSEFQLDYEKAEGVAYNSKDGLIYIVSDKTGKLYVYKNVKKIFELN